MITPERMADILKDAERAEKYSSTTIRVTIPEVKSLLTLAKSALEAIKHHEGELAEAHAQENAGCDFQEPVINYHRARIEAIKGGSV